MPQLDEYKQAIVNEYTSSSKNIFVNATAGSGKTFTLCELSRRTPPVKSSIFMAFNKSIAEELQNRLPPQTKASTLHSYALSSLRKAFNFDFQLSDSKNFKFVLEHIKFPHVHVKRIPGLAVQICRLYDLMRFNLVGDDIEALISLGERYGEDVDEQIAEKTIELHRLNRKAADNYFLKGYSSGKLSIDFTDMLYYAVKYIDDADFKRYNVVMLDECQDISPLQFELVKRCKTPRGRLIAVGDMRQSIYSFMGSNLDSLHAIKSAPNTVSLPLSMTYRCARNIVDEACTVFPNSIVAAPGAQEGVVGYKSYLEANDGDFILCRNNSPLVKAFIDLLRQGKKCSILGKEYGEDLVRLIDSVNDIFGLEQVLTNFQEKLKAKGVRNPERNESYGTLEEKVHVLLDLWEYFGNLESVRDQIKNIFVENQNRGILLSTVHKSKGLEADRVFFLEPDLIPSKFAVTELALYAEKCLKFVAITRARRELYYCYLK